MLVLFFDSLSSLFSAMWKQIVGVPNMDGFVKNPDILSFYIASKIPVSESTRQELLEIDGISYRLRREIELLKSIDIIQCKNCKVVNSFFVCMLALVHSTFCICPQLLLPYCTVCNHSKAYIAAHCFYM